MVYKTNKLSAAELKLGYEWAYDEFYSWKNIVRSSLNHQSDKHKLKHLAYAGSWKKFEPVWNFLIKTKGLNQMLPVLESILSKVRAPDFQLEENTTVETTSIPKINFSNI